MKKFVKCGSTKLFLNREEAKDADLQLRERCAPNESPKGSVVLLSKEGGR